MKTPTLLLLTFFSLQSFAQDYNLEAAKIFKSAKSKEELSMKVDSIIKNTDDVTMKVMAIMLKTNMPEVKNNPKVMVRYLTFLINHQKEMADFLGEDENSRDRSNVYNLIGIQHKALGNLDSAIMYFKQGLEIYPNHPLILINMAGAYLYKEDYEAVIDIVKPYQDSIDIEYTNYMLARSYYGLNKNDFAFEYIQRYFKTDSHETDFLAYKLKGDILRVRKDDSFCSVYSFAKSIVEAQSDLLYHNSDNYHGKVIKREYELMLEEMRRCK